MTHLNHTAVGMAFVCAAAVLGVPDIMRAADPQGLSVGGTEDGVTLEGQRAVADLDAAEPKLTLTFTARSTVPIAVSAVEVGVLLAEDAADLEAIEPADLYAGLTSDPGITVLRRSVPVQLPARGQAPLRFDLPVHNGEPPGAFQTHVLGYRLATIDLGVMLNLLHGRSAADEMAAVLALGLAGGATEATAARPGLASDAALLEGLVVAAAAPIAPRPTQDQTLERVYAVLGLGVLGGERARATLDELAGREALSLFDEPLQILRAARLARGPIGAPLAHAIPVDAQVMADVVAVARAWVDDLNAARVPAAVRAAADLLGATPGPVLTDIDLDMASSEPQASGDAVVVALGVGAATFAAILLLLWLREPRRTVASPPATPGNHEEDVS